MRYALEVQYRGKCYAGSQIQFENGEQIAEPTIQGELEKALSTLIKCDSSVTDNTRPIKTIFSGRTDKGVNSLGQVVHFDYDKDIVASKFVYHFADVKNSKLFLLGFVRFRAANPQGWYTQR